MLAFTHLVLFSGLIINLHLESLPKAYIRPYTVTANQVEGNYKWKTVTITPGIDYGKGPVTDMLSMMKATDKCVQDLVITFHGGGTVTIAKPASCEDQMAMGITEKSHWVRKNDTLIVTESDGASTTFALSFTGTVMRLSGKISISSSHAEQKDHLLIMELVRQ